VLILSISTLPISLAQFRLPNMFFLDKTPLMIIHIGSHVFNESKPHIVLNAKNPDDVTTVFYASAKAKDNSAARITMSSGRPTSIDNTKSRQLLSLASDKQSYSLDEMIRLKGNVTSDIKNDNATITNNSVPIIIKAFEANNTFYTHVIKSDNRGKFSDSFFAPTDGTIKITGSTVAQNDSTEQQVLSVIVNKPIWPMVLLVFIVGAAFGVLFFVSPKYQRYSISTAIVLTVIGYILIYRYPPLGGLGNSAVAVAVFAPLAAYAIDALNKRRDANSLTESAVSSYRDENLKREVQSLIKIHEEITAHQAIFSAKYDYLDKELPKLAFTDVGISKIGTMANLPGLRICKYYYYVDKYNEILRDKIYLESNEQDEVYKYFDVMFQDLKRIYRRLNEILYVNLIYDEGEIQRKFLSFPSVDFPTRLSLPVTQRLVAAGILRDTDDKQTDKIYNHENALKLVNIIGREFEETFRELEQSLIQYYS
jgi:hypothetical protein